MPGMSGIQFLNALHRRPLIVFTTAYSDYAARSYDYDAKDQVKVGPKLIPIGKSFREDFLKKIGTRS